MDPERLHTLKEFQKAFDKVRDDFYRVIDSENYALMPGQFEVGQLPNDPQEGSVLYDESRKMPTWWDGSNYEWPDYTQDVLTSPVTVGNTAQKTQVWAPGLDANSMVAGRTYEMELAGTFETASTSDHFTVTVDVAGTEAAGVQNASGDYPAGSAWTVTLVLTVRSDGQNGEVKPNTRAIFDDSPTAASTQPVTIDTTTAEDLQVSVEWNNAKTGNVATLQQAHLTQKN